MPVFSDPMPTEVPDSPLWRSTGARREDLVRTRLVRAGTSRIIVVDRRDAPADVDDADLALRLFGRDSVGDGLGGDHYQLNKLAIWRPTASGGFEFTFFNLAPGSRRVSRGAECGHAAVAVALVAGPDRGPGESGTPIRVRNVDTDQILDVSPRTGPEDPFGARLARVIHDPPVVAARGVELAMPPDSAKEIRWEVVPAGNLFALVPGVDTCEDGDVRETIQSMTLEWARTAAVPKARKEFVRTISHDVRWLDDAQARVEAVCHNGAERHNSLPVSGSAALCNQLAIDRMLGSDFAMPGDPEEVDFEFDVRSISGGEIVRVHARHRSGSWRIESTSCNTHARLLIEGTAFLSR